MRSMIYPVGIQSFEEIRKGDCCYLEVFLLCHSFGKNHFRFFAEGNFTF